MAKKGSTGYSFGFGRVDFPVGVSPRDGENWVSCSEIVEFAGDFAALAELICDVEACFAESILITPQQNWRYFCGLFADCFVVGWLFGFDL
jgi:hypothetical protein